MTNKAYVKQWCEKASNDLKVAENEFKIKEFEPITDVICFHCQQAAEKYLKAYLITKKIDFGKTHNLEYLLKLCAQCDKDFENVNVGDLSFYAVEVRYPDDFYMPSLEEAEESLKIAKEIESFIKQKLK